MFGATRRPLNVPYLAVRSLAKSADAAPYSNRGQVVGTSRGLDVLMDLGWIATYGTDTKTTPQLRLGTLVIFSNKRG